MNYYRKILFIILLLAIAMTTACNKPDAYDTTGQAIYLKDYRGKWIILNYWADWCHPCYLEIPVLNHLYQEHKDNMIVFGINFDDLPQEKLEDFISKNNVQYPLLTSDLGKLFGIHNITTLPTTFVISPEGKIVHELYGEQKENELLQIMHLA